MNALIQVSPGKCRYGDLPLWPLMRGQNLQNMGANLRCFQLLSVYIYAYVCMHVCEHVCMPVFSCVFVCVCKCVCMAVCTCICALCMHVCIYVCMHECVHVYMHVYICTSPSNILIQSLSLNPELTSSVSELKGSFCLPVQL